MFRKSLYSYLLSFATFAILFLVSVRPTYAAVIFVTNTNTSGAGSLSQAISQANLASGSAIQFNIPGSGPHVITTNNGFVITESTFIDGTTQPGYSGIPLIEIRASSASAIIAFDVQTTVGATIIRGLSITNFTNAAGIAINLNAGEFHVLEANYIGVTALNTVMPNANGVFVESQNSSIVHNRIENNTAIGISITGSSAANNLVTGNSILNNNVGVKIYNGAHDITIGSTVAADRNIVGNNAREGIYIDNSGGNNTLIGNYIGVAVDGITPLGNGEAGIRIEGTSSGNTIGDTAAGAGNVISDNATGILIGINNPNHVIRGNFIGTDFSGTVDVGNTGDGISIGSGNNIIGGNTAAARNIISGNGGNGIMINGAAATNNTIQGNYIGTDSAGTGALGNSQGGLVITNNATNNTVGSIIDTAAGNIVAFNSGRGIGVLMNSQTNPVNRNRVFSNGLLGIELGDAEGNEAPNLNDLGDNDTGSNGLQNYPVLTVTTQATSTISGTLNSRPNGTYMIEFFRSTACDPLGFGEGEVYLGSTSMTTDGSGNGSFNFPLGEAIPGGEFVTATATSVNPPSDNGNTSEFSACVRASADLALTHTDSEDPILAGTILSYTVTVNNTSAQNYANNVVITETLSSGVTYDSATPSQGSCNHVTGVVTCNIGTINNSANASVVINVTVNPATSGTFTSTASVSSSTLDPNTANNSAAQNTVSAQFLPSGSVTTGYGNPIYQFPDQAGAQYYYLIVNNSAGAQIINEVISDAGYCTAGVCSIDATTLRESYRLVNGTYTVFLNTWNGTSQGAWKGPFMFTLNAPVPAAPTLNAPTNTNSLRPTFHWTVSGDSASAMYFNLVVAPTTNPSAPSINQWFTRAAACGSPNGTTCSLVSPIDLADATNYAIYLRSYGSGGISSFTGPQNFLADVLPPTLPSGITVNNNQGRATFTWNDDANTLYFNVYITNNAGVSQHNAWYARSSVCSGGSCSISPVLALANGQYQIRVKAWGSGGFSTGGMANDGFGGPTAFTFNFAAPNIADLNTFSPNGAVTTGSPTFTWNTLAGTTYYLLWVTGASPSYTPSYHQMWYDASAICTPHPGTCTVSNVVALPMGNAVWRVQAYGPGGVSALHSDIPITVNSTLPVAPTLNNPTGSITSTAPTFMWVDDANVDWYNLYVYTTSTSVVNQWVRAERGVGKLCNAGTCSFVVPNTTLANGSYSWNVRGYGPAGVGGWGTMLTFTVAVPAAGVPTQVTPNDGAVINSTNRPTFVWNTTPFAIFYHLEVKNGMGIIAFDMWYAANTGVCTLSECTVQLPNPIAYGGYTWRVQAYSQGGLSAFSAARSFFSLSINPNPMMVQSEAGQVARGGSWSTLANERTVGQSYLSSSGSTADTLTFAFTGTSAEVVYVAGPNYGSFVIEVDGIAVRTVNANAAQESVGNLAAVSGLSAGQHTLRIVPLGGAPVAIDALITDGEILTAVTAPVATPTMVIPTAVVTEEVTALPTENPPLEPTLAPTEIPIVVTTEVPTEALIPESTEIPTEIPTEVVTPTS
jgi:hypothetical protein